MITVLSGGEDKDTISLSQTSLRYKQHQLLGFMLLHLLSTSSTALMDRLLFCTKQL